MNTEKILALLGTTPANKLETARRIEAKIPLSACESANDLLNSELYPAAVKGAIDCTKRNVNRRSKSAIEALDAQDSAGVSYGDRLESLYPGLDWFVVSPTQRSDDGWCIEAAKQHTTIFYEDESSEPELSYEQVIQKLLNKEVRWGEGEEEGFLYLDNNSPASPAAEDAASIGPNSAVPSTGAVVSAPVLKKGVKESAEGDEEGTLFNLSFVDPKTDRVLVDVEFNQDVTDEQLGAVQNAIEVALGWEGQTEQVAEEAAATEAGKCKSRRLKVGKSSSVTETFVETSPDAGFPETFDFDDEAFAEEYGIDPETLQVMFVPEESEVPAHIEVSFKYEDSVVTLIVNADNSVAETVDAEVVEPAQFSANFAEVEDEDGGKKMALLLDLVEEDGPVKSEEDAASKSEEETDPVDADGKAQSPEEFVQQAGLDLDEFHAKNAGIPVAPNPADRIDPVKGTARANESLAAKVAKK